MVRCTSGTGLNVNRSDGVMRQQEPESARGVAVGSSFSMTRIVEFCETDMAGIVHFSRFYIWMEQAEHAFLRSLGLTVSDHQEDGSTIGFPRVSASCRFLAPAKFEDEVTVVLTIQRIGVKSMTYDVEFFRGDLPVARGTLKTACCRFRPGHPFESIEIPADYRKRFEAFADGPSESARSEAR